MTRDRVYEVALFLFAFALFYDSCWCSCTNFLFYHDYLHIEAQQISVTLIESVYHIPTQFGVIAGITFPVILHETSSNGLQIFKI